MDPPETVIGKKSVLFIEPGISDEEQPDEIKAEQLEIQRPAESQANILMRVVSSKIEQLAAIASGTDMIPTPSQDEEVIPAVEEKIKKTKEERKALRKAKRAAAKLSKKLAAIEHKKQLKRDALQREIDYGKLTVKRHEKEWREMLINFALPRVRGDVEIAWHNFERVIDAKDLTISLLMDELDYAEEQYGRNFSQHLENIQNIMNLFAETLREFQGQFNNELAELQNVSNDEANIIKSQFDENKKYLKTILYCLSQQAKNRERTMRIEYIGHMKDEQTIHTLVLQNLRIGLELKFQKLLNSANQFFDDFNKSLAEHKRTHDTMKAQDDELNIIITKQYEQIKDSYNTIRNLKQKLHNVKQIEDQKIYELQAERDFFHKSFTVFKQKLQKDVYTDKEKISLLSYVCSEVFDYLKGLKKKNENILTIAGVCRKLETQQEKIMAFPSTTMLDVITTSPQEYIPELELFFQRVGQAGCRKMELEEEIKFLREENIDLSRRFKIYCKNTQCGNPTPIRKSLPINITDIKSVAQNYNKWTKKN